MNMGRFKKNKKPPQKRFERKLKSYDERKVETLNELLGSQLDEDDVRVALHETEESRERVKREKAVIIGPEDGDTVAVSMDKDFMLKLVDMSKDEMINYKLTQEYKNLPDQVKLMIGSILGLPCDCPECRRVTGRALTGWMKGGKKDD